MKGLLKKLFKFLAKNKDVIVPIVADHILKKK